MYIGLRRVYLNLHVDDLFMASDTWDVKKKVSNEDVSYRITASELNSAAQVFIYKNTRYYIRYWMRY